MAPPSRVGKGGRAASAGGAGASRGGALSAARAAPGVALPEASQPQATAAGRRRRRAIRRMAEDPAKGVARATNADAFLVPASRQLGRVSAAEPWLHRGTTARRAIRRGPRRSDSRRAGDQGTMQVPEPQLDRALPHLRRQLPWAGNWGSRGLVTPALMLVLIFMVILLCTRKELPVPTAWYGRHDGLPIPQIRRRGLRRPARRGARAAPRRSPAPARRGADDAVAAGVACDHGAPAPALPWPSTLSSSRTKISGCSRCMKCPPGMVTTS